jgi:tetrahedral aminopeptidase
MDIAPLLKKLSQAPGLSGHEAGIRAIVLEEFGRFATETHVDKMGNAVALLRGSDRAAASPSTPRRSIMLATHMDEIGLMVAGVKHGFIHVVAVGGMDARILLGQEVIVHTQRGVHGRRALPGRDLPGIVASTPPHLLKASERTKIIPLDKLWIDVGLPARQVEQLVQVGDLISMRRSVLELKNGLLAGKAFDNRASVTAVAVCLEQLQQRQHAWDVLAVATVQEEETLLGAATSAFALQPDVAIAIDVTFGTQVNANGVETFALGKGPTVNIGPNMHPKMTQGLLAAAKRIELEARLEPLPGHSGTDGWAIQVARSGIPTGIVAIPLRSMHTPVETVALADIERTGRLLAEFICGLDEEFYRSLIDR